MSLLNHTSCPRCLPHQKQPMLNDIPVKAKVKQCVDLQCNRLSGLLNELIENNYFRSGSNFDEEDFLSAAPLPEVGELPAHPIFKSLVMKHRSRGWAVARLWVLRKARLDLDGDLAKRAVEERVRD